MTRPAGSSKYSTTGKNIRRYFTPKHLIRYIYQCLILPMSLEVDFFCNEIFINTKDTYDNNVQTKHILCWNTTFTFCVFCPLAIVSQESHLTVINVCSMTNPVMNDNEWVIRAVFSWFSMVWANVVFPSLSLSKRLFWWGVISGRDFCASKLVRLVIGRDFASENATPDGMWVQGSLCRDLFLIGGYVNLI